MAYDLCAEQAALHNIETCDAAIRRINGQIADLQAERGKWEEKREQWDEKAGEQKLLFEEEETRRQERAVR